MKHICMYLLVAFFVLCSGVVSDNAFAQGMELDTIRDAGSRAEDRSRQSLISIFGDVVQNPLSAADDVATDSLLAKTFLIFNSVLAVIASILVLYYFIKLITRTAQAGTIGSSVNSWGVIRVVVGIAMLIPTPNGWSIAQLLMLYATTLGIGSANLATDEAVDALSLGTGMILEPATPDNTALAKQLFEMNLCAIATNADYDRQAAMGINVDPSWRQVSSNLPDNNGFIIQASGNRKQCGGAYIDLELLEDQDIDADSYVPGLDSQTIYEAHVDALATMQTSMMTSAQQFVSQYLQSRTMTVSITDPTLAINQAARQYEATLTAVAQERDGDLDDLANSISEDVGEKGWWTLGAYYQTFAQANAKINSAVQGAAVVKNETLPNNRNQTYEDVLVAYQAEMSESDASSPLAYNNPLAPSHGSSTLSQIISAPMQSLVNAITDLDFERRGGDITNPLIKMKNLGDTILMTAGAIGTVHVTSGAVSEGLTSLPIVGGVFGFVDGIFETLSPYIFTIVLSLVIVGFSLAIYIPFVPFIIWFAAIINWLVVVVEAVVAAPLWAAAHLVSTGSGEEEGMGQRSLHGYLFLFNVILRPPLMVIAFFAAGAILVVGGLFLNEIFSTVVANVQYDAWTGIFSVIGICFVYVILCSNLVHSCFNLVFIIPDQVISWIGGHASSSLGRDSNEQGNRYFGAMTRRGEGISRDFRADHRNKPPKEPKGDGFKQ